ncbi:MAG TPA: choice-of-anchor Q domain-containing protein, partial [Tepidisphaeraceae bacterium]|nr:choice-of-anchor Q domain-containing protein [Tepidisphaeraceae bacterium]
GGFGITTSGDGGKGAYGGGGGGGAAGGGNGGSSDFGGGGGSGWAGAFGGTNGGRGGFGGGGGAAADGYIEGGGNPGKGGHFGGHANQRQGGGGGGLGGAIFNDSGTLLVENSTFYDNYAAHGFGGGYPSASRAADGGDAGGAIFSRNGSTTIVNATIASNQGTGQGSGIVVYEDGEATSFVLQNTIIAKNNGANACFWTGNVSHGGVGNLIMNNGSGTQPFGACDDPRVTTDPQLGLLQDNGGPTYTMAIPLFSSAMSAADPATSLPYDQRYADRPQVGGYDIGAYEICRRFIVGLRLAPCSETNIPPPSTVTLTMQASPSNGGTTTPASGNNEEQVNAVIPIVASPTYGYLFGGWSANVTDASNPATTVIMDSSKTVAANFTYCNCALDVTSAIRVTRGGLTLNPVTGRYAQTITLINTSSNTIAGSISLVLDSLSSNAALFNLTGTTDALESPAGSPYANVTSSSLPAGGSVSFALQFTNPSHTVITYSTRVLAGPGSR